jgi:hypothetical protein
MIKHADSHLDHSITADQLAWLCDSMAGHDAFVIETLELPPELGTVPCGLFGPVMGDEPITDDAPVVNYPRAGRDWPSRLVDREPRQVRLVTVVAGPHDGHPCVLFTAYGGPCAPQEPDDPRCKDPVASRAFWSTHALAV